MAAHYFSTFPQITYANTPCMNIMARSAFLKSVFADPYIYYPYEVADAERADHLSWRYYGDSYASWVLYFSNQIIDPYYAWYMSQDQFQSFVETKYGSVPLAMSKTKRYQCDWFSDESTLTPAGYEALPDILQQYWEPNQFGDYSRAPIDRYVTTNQIVAYTVNPVGFVEDEVVTVTFNPSYVGQGQVVGSSNTELFLQHTSGVMFSNSIVVITGSSALRGAESGTNTVFTSVRSVCNNISIDEQVYYTAETYYAYESNLNEKNRNIKVLDSSMIGVVSQNLIDVMKE